MRSSSTFTFGNRVCNSRARSQCVVARRPVEQTCFSQHERAGAVEATRRDRPKASRRNLDTPGVNAPATALPPTISVSKFRIVERLRRDADADRTADGPAGLGKQMQS